MALESELEPVNIGSWDEFVPALKQKLTELGCDLTQVAIRHYEKDRTELLKKTGTDRDKKSHLYDEPEDLDHGVSRKPIDPSTITYARTLDLSQEPVRPIPFFRQPLDSMDNLNYLRNLSNTLCMAVYTLSTLRRVTENEYRFIGNPRNALIAIFLVNGIKN